MTTTVPETDTEIGLEILEHLDFEPELDCEHQNHGSKPWHSGPAAYYVTGNEPCGNCGYRVQQSIMLCAPAWTAWGEKGVQCVGCERGRPRDEIVKIIGSVK